MRNLLKELCGLNGVSGCEYAVRDFIGISCIQLGLDIKTDSMGNVFVLKKGKNAGTKTIMICAHMDEVGMIVKSVTDDGMLKFGFVGGIDPRVVVGKRVAVGREKVIGVVGIKAVHLTTEEERKKTLDESDLYIDIGCVSKRDALESVSLGDCCSFVSSIADFGDGFICAKALDDRIGCAVMLKLMEYDFPQDIHFVFTVQEEVGLRGATVSAFSVNPDICLILEGTTAADLPHVKGFKRVCCLNEGVVIPFMDKATVYDKDLLKFVQNIAQENDIAYQTKSMVAGGTDAGAIHKSNGGVKTVAFSAPVRYIHAPSSVCSYRDVENILKLSKIFLERIGEFLYD